MLEALYFLPFGLYVIAVYWISKTKQKFPSDEMTIVLMLFALVFSATFLFSNPMSHDIYRYYWDGKVVNHGFSPYARADSAQMANLRDANWQKIYTRWATTIYPPLSQVMFALAYFISPDIFSFKLTFTIFALLSGYVIIVILRELGFEIKYAMIYAWAPLVAIEFPNSGHNDSLAVFFVLLSYLCLVEGEKIFSAGAMALAALSKLYPALFAPLFFKRWGKKGVAVFVAVIGLFYLPFILTSGWNTFDGFMMYAEKGVYNGSVFPLLVWVFASLGLGDASLNSKAVIYLVFALVLLYLFSKSMRPETTDLDLWRYSFLLTGTFLILTPTVHPWYIAWIIPFLCFFRSSAWILLSGSIILSRSVYIAYDAIGVWHEIWWIRPLEYAAFFILLSYELLKGRHFGITRTRLRSLSQTWRLRTR